MKWTAPEVAIDSGVNIIYLYVHVYALKALHYRKYSVRSDVWSYGCVLYEIWSLGNSVYEELTITEVML